MTYQETYDVLLKMTKSIDMVNSKEGDAIALALTALSKLIVNNRQWTPIAVDKHGETDTYKCPICNNYVSIRYKSDKCDYEYCPHCGFKITD